MHEAMKPSEAKPRKRIAVVGAGIAGLATAWLLSRRHHVVLYEANGYLGGHTNTVDVTLDGVTHPVDTGFLVFNHRTYPNLVALFKFLGVETAASEMSFAVSLGDAADPGLEWSGCNAGSLFAQKRNLLRPGFWGMLRDIMRFNKVATAMARAGDAGPVGEQSLAAFLDQGRYGRTFREAYLLPMIGAIWSCPTETMLAYPVVTLARFCDNHGLLQISNRPQWYTVKGGGREYVKKLAAGIGHVHSGTAVTSVSRGADGVQVCTANGVATFDEVVMACHSDQSLRLLQNPSDDIRRVLGAVSYQSNRAVLHTDAALLPRARKAWAAWNYLAARAATDRSPVGVSYWLNRLQPLPFRRPVIVTLNPPRKPDPEQVIAWFDYEHPVFDLAAIRAQQQLPGLQGRDGLWFCGAWCGYGFHEDGLTSALAVVNALGISAPWQARAAATAHHAAAVTAAQAAPETETPA
jgi:predicted NAD/FAD-binding protein